MILKGAIFDMDGTLLDSNEVWENAGKIYLESEGIVPEPDIRNTFNPMTLNEVAKYCQDIYGLQKKSYDIIEGINKVPKIYYANKAKLKPGILKLLDTFKEAGIIMTIATATDRHLTEVALKRTGISDYFKKIFTCSEEGCGKSQPDIFFSAMKSMGTDFSNTLVFEDASYAIETCVGAGFKVVGIADRYERFPNYVETASNIYVKDTAEIDTILAKIKDL